MAQDTIPCFRFSVSAPLFLGLLGLYIIIYAEESAWKSVVLLLLLWKEWRDDIRNGHMHGKLLEEEASSSGTGDFLRVGGPREVPWEVLVFAAAHEEMFNECNELL